MKRIGAAVFGSTIASSGLLSLTSCNMKKTKRIIFYFTGTGNCLYVARQLGGKDAELISIPQLMKHKKFKFEADEIGLVYPIYGHMPQIWFAVLTYGNRKCSAVEIWDDVSRKAGTKFDYINTIKNG